VATVEGFDITGLDTPWDDDAGNTESAPAQESETSPVKRRVGVCGGHERALPVHELVHLLDMKEEGNRSRTAFELCLNGSAPRACS
jgi:hypothetical protein